jgi:KUP system potassium uptake protein
MPYLRYTAGLPVAKQKGFAGLTIAAMGIVYGDIGTSPLYALNQIFFGHAGLPPEPDNVLGGISLGSGP